MNRGSGARIHLQLLYKCEPADLYHLYSVGTLGKIIEKGVKISPRRSWWSRLGLGQKLLKEAGLWWQIIGLKFCGLGVHIALGARLFYAKKPTWLFSLWWNTLWTWILNLRNFKMIFFSKKNQFLSYFFQGGFYRNPNIDCFGVDSHLNNLPIVDHGAPIHIPIFPS